MKITKAVYVTSAVNSENFISDGLNQFAFVGRSNVGKSSLINSLVGQKKLAKTSQTPGLTKMVNYFLINDSFYFVDLPGYGYSKTGKKHNLLWSTLIEDFLNSSFSLKKVFLLADCRHEPSELDKLMQSFLYCNQIPYKIIATKCDKIPKSKLASNVAMLARAFKIGPKDIILHSSLNKYGNENIYEVIENANGEIDEN